MNHALVTGAAGFIGRACVNEFLSHGWRVTALVHRNCPQDLISLEESGRIAVARADMEDYGSLIESISDTQKFNGRPIDSMVHCAARASDTGRDSQFRKANFEGAISIAKCLLQLDAGRLVFVSTTDVYGLKDFKSAGEQTPYCNNLHNPYPKYKIAAEIELKRLLPPDRLVILRPAAVWGPGDTTILPRLLKFTQSSPAIVHFGKWRGRNRWPMCYIGNMAKAARLASSGGFALGRSINVLDTEVTSIDGYYRMIHEIFSHGGTPYRSVNMPFWTGALLGAASSLLSSAAGRDRPLFDPSLYGLYSVSKNLDLNNALMRELFEAAGERPEDRQTAIAQFRAWAATRPSSSAF